MIWNNRQHWWQKLHRPQSFATTLDQRLVTSVRKNKLPSVRQIKYLGSFLSSGEKKIISLCLVAIFLATAVLASRFFIRHSTHGPKAGGGYTEALIGQPKYINPLFAGVNDVDSDLTSLIYSGLFTLSNDQKIIPELAKSYTVSPDGKTYTIALQKDIRWSDNEPFNADDVIFTIEMAQNPDVVSPLFPTFQGVQTTKIDEHTVQFSLKEPFAPFLHSLTVGILPSHIWAEIPPSNLKLAGTNLHPIGTGPWMFNKLTKDNNGTVQTYNLIPNNHYFAHQPYLQSLTFKFFNDYNEALESLKSQEVDGLSFIPREAKSKLPGKATAAYTLELPQYTAIFFNQTKQPFLKNDNLRLALITSINKETLIAEGLEGGAHAIDSPLLPASQLNNQPPAFDVEKANTLLDKNWSRIEPEEYFKLRSAELRDALATTTSTLSSSTPTLPSDANSKETDLIARNEMNSEQSFYRKDKKNNILTLTITTADTPEYRHVGEVIAKFWRAIGIQVNLQLVNPRQMAREIIKPRAYEMLLYGEIVGSDPDPFSFWHSSQVDYPGLNLSLYANRNADKLLEEARTTLDEEKRANLYKKFQDLLLADLPAIFLYTPAYTYAIRKDIKGVVAGPISSPSGRFAGLQNWYIKTSWTWKK